MLLPILPDEVRLPLDDAGYKGLVAVYRPMDVEDKGRWFDECKGDIEGAEAKVLAVRRQLIRIEGLEAQTPDGKREPFDGQNAAHFKALPMGIILPVFFDMLSRMSLNEEDRRD